MTKQTIVQLERRIEFTRIPCVGEWLRFESSGLLPHEVTEVTHDEQGSAEVVVGVQRDERGQFIFHETAEDLQGDVDDLVASGWRVVSSKPNTAWGDV
jgi:hypothetical protein